MPLTSFTHHNYTGIADSGNRVSLSDSAGVATDHTPAIVCLIG